MSTLNKIKNYRRKSKEHLENTTYVRIPKAAFNYLSKGSRNRERLRKSIIEDGVGLKLTWIHDIIDDDEVEIFQRKWAL